MKARLTPLRIVSLYAIVGGLWILFSDKAMMAIVKDHETIARIGIIKGLVFVFATSLLIYFLIRRYACEREEIEKKIRESGQYNRALFENSTIGLALCRMDGSLVDVNETYANIIGRTVEETLKLTYWEITPEKYATQEQEQLESLKATGSYGPYEKEYIHKDGRLVPVRLQGRIIEQLGEKFIWSSVEDIRKRKEVENELRLSEEKFAKVFRSSPDTILLTDISNGRIVEVNEAFCRRTGYSRDEAIGRTTLELNIWMNENDRNRFITALREKGRVVDMEFSFRHRNGDVVICLLFAEIIALSGGTYMIGILRDITERRIAEESLKDREAQLSLFVEYSPAAIAMFDCDMKYIVASRRWLTDYYLGDIQITGRSHYDIFPDIPERWKEIHKRGLAGAVEMCEEDPFHRADGRIDWVRWEMHPWRQSAGGIGGIIIFSEVITGRKHAEEELIKYRDHLEELVRERTAELEKKISEIERLNRIFVGRELRMKELKEKIKELEEVASFKSQGSRKKRETRNY